jgi:hypothetical protein
MINLPPPQPSLYTDMFDFSPVPVEDKVAKKIAEMRKMPKRGYANLWEWTAANRPFLVPGRPFRMDNHLYLKEIYECTDLEIILMKASQMGASEWLVSYAAYICDEKDGTVLYLFPTEGHVSDFSTARLGPAIEASEYLSKIVIDGSGQGGQRGSDRISLKRIRDRFLYFRGSKVQADGKAPQLKSIDADVLIMDEVDELDPRAPAIAKKRLGHAKDDLGNVLWVSTPTYPGVGIHAEFLESDQRKWFVKCDACGERQSLEIDQVVNEWDDLGRPVEWNGRLDNRAWVACRNCGAELNRLGDGEWVAEHPEADRTGFHLTKLFSAQTPLIQVVKDLDTVDENKRREAYNQHLGIPYTPRGGSLDSERLDACRRDYGHGPNYFRTCYMGVDVGRVLHVTVRTSEGFQDRETMQLYAGESTWEHLPNLVKIYRPRIIVCDALPETTKAREFQQNYPRNMVWLAYYPNMPQGSKKEENMIWNPRERTVLLDRTRVIDETLAGFYGMTSTLPAHIRGVRDYYKQMMSSIRTLKEDATGQQVAKYIETGPDHFLHSEVYAYVASKTRYGQGWVEGAGS